MTFTTLNYLALTHDSSLTGILKQYSTAISPRILDLGCGVGTHTLSLANVFTNAELLGIDISSSNITAALKTVADNRQYNIKFVETDYLTLNDSGFDIIHAESVLHLITADDADLYQKISNDLNKNGILAVTMPYDCIYNRLLITARQLLKILRNPLLDKCILKIASWLHPEIDIAVLRDRIPYMYIIPQRLYSKRLQNLFDKKYNLKVIYSEKCQHASLAKPRHKIILFQKN
ncbi:hypothetical protein AYO45_01170 [Gammaproteobacteria bacterium SCGC AG-212-F23]|nr:hypothetical protein AYO45_01170 [Gammaproteobacteria bacterium SCGC AG-212-F23]